MFCALDTDIKIPHEAAPVRGCVLRFPLSEVTLWRYTSKEGCFSPPRALHLYIHLADDSISVNHWSPLLLDFICYYIRKHINNQCRIPVTYLFIFLTALSCAITSPYFSPASFLFTANSGEGDISLSRFPSTQWHRTPLIRGGMRGVVCRFHT